ncbi:MobQ family relaxase [Paenibacillus chibensis]|uniref:MobQ family relaxase n=1 Tax=Paenibacillus chibensis TaxID=59846 RepID=UPI000FD99DE3|nr:MobQ family relaxase [Paenibacillus chibensis]MEC0373331.1 MobQ family relaxase [Paenibacillus chibensis]
MAIFHLRMQVIRRSEGRSAVAAASYRSGEDLYDEKYGKQHRGFRKERYLIESEILAPENAPDWVYDRERLWNEVEKVEDKSTRRATAQLAREFDVALPRELPYGIQRELLIDFVKKEFVDRGMIADVCIHRDNSENPHAHVMLTMREITPEGFGNKNREWNGDFVTYKGAEKVGKGWRNNVNAEKLLEWRSKWAEYANKFLEREGIDARIDHRSLKEQGLTDRVPTIHEGPNVREMEERGIYTDRGALNRAAKEHNAIVVELETYRKEKVAYQQKEAEKAISGREEGQSPVAVGNDIKNIAQERGASMNVIEQRPDMAYEFYTEQKKRLDKEYGLYKRREQFVKEKEALTSNLETERFSRNERAEIREKIEKLDKQISKLPELTEVSKSLMREEYRTIEAKLQEVFKVAEKRSSRTSDVRVPELVKEKGSASVVDLHQVQALKLQRDAMFSERNTAEHSYSTLQRKQDLSEQKKEALQKKLDDLGPNRWWQRGKNAQREQLQRELETVKKEIAERDPELQRAKANFEKVNKDYQEASHAFRAVKEVEHKEKLRHRQAMNQQERER